jgi:hypothetical protein
MSESSKHHFYHYTARSVVLADYAWCGGKILLYVMPPEKALTIENMFVHFKATFDSAIPSGQRLVKSISIVDKRPFFYDSNSDVNYMRTLDLNILADGSRKVDIKVDISHLLKKDNVGFREYFSDSSTPNLTYVMIEPDDSLIGNNNIGRIDLWKLDAQFTTQGIR